MSVLCDSPAGDLRRHRAHDDVIMCPIADHRDDHDDNFMMMGKYIQVDLYMASVTSVIVVCICLFVIFVIIIGHMSQYYQIMSLRRRYGAEITTCSGAGGHDNLGAGYHELSDKGNYESPKLDENTYKE